MNLETFNKANEIQIQIDSLSKKIDLLESFKNEQNLPRDVSLRDVFDAIGTSAVQRLIGERITELDNEREAQKERFIKL